MNAKQTVVVAMSGGVDSATVAALLHDRGYQVVGVSLRLYRADNEPDNGFASAPAFGSCCSLDDLAGARRMAHELGIPHYTVDMVQEFHDTVFRNFVAEYSRGRTPSPCVHCNDLIKFSKLSELAEDMGALAVATGHYARIEKAGKRCRLLRGVDETKDQSYFLARTPEKKLASLMFPLGGMTKTEVRSLAAKYRLRAASKPDSQDLCFVPDGDTAGFLDSQIADPLVGPLLTPDGARAGMHAGVHRFTPGQRKGHGISWREPLYVKEIRADGSVQLAERSAACASRFTVGDLIWIHGKVPDQNEALSVKIRYRSDDVPCTIRVRTDDAVEVELSVPVFAPAPGQLAAFYQGDEVLGGGFLEEVVG